MKKVYTKHRALLVVHAASILTSEENLTDTSKDYYAQKMTDSIELPLLKLPHIRPSSNNTINTEGPISDKAGRK